MKINILFPMIRRIAVAIFVFFLGLNSLYKLSGHPDDINYILSIVCFIAAPVIAFTKWRSFYVHLVWMLFWSVSIQQLYQRYLYYRTSAQLSEEMFFEKMQPKTETKGVPTKPLHDTIELKTPKEK